METIRPTPDRSPPHACAADAARSACASARRSSVERALGYEYLTVGWNVVEGIVSLVAAMVSGSVALLAFGADSFVECASALVLIWRLRAERAHRLSMEELDAFEHRARRLVATSLFLLAAYVSFDAVLTLWTVDRPAFSVLGVGVLTVSVGVMLWLARRKRQLAHELDSEALEADAFQTTACWWLSVAALLGVGLNGLFGWWWADPAAALVIAGLIAHEGRNTWKGRSCC